VRVATGRVARALAFEIRVNVRRRTGEGFRSASKRLGRKIAVDDEDVFAGHGDQATQVGGGPPQAARENAAIDMRRDRRPGLSRGAP
jgi:hypothetical protein